ncbi:hypothetical protein F0L68_16240 [Solihabitans fulvus]|uniref:DUF3558 domain-containing protein n=1 Tax=Solihabitans fulvus TaxID=1892852 RepID=A0A5B2XEI8_9PSEU|nr:hypothetical protein F0L68_16240 [Solihabitans fulvus]
MRRLAVLGVAVSAGCAVALTGCAAAKRAPVAAPQIPTIVASTAVTTTVAPADRPLPDDCKLVVPAVDVDGVVGQPLDGQPARILGVPEPTVGRTGKLDCYYGIPEGRTIASAAIVIGLATYADEASAQQRVRDSVDSERQDGAGVADIAVEKMQGKLVTGKTERMVIGSLGRTTYVVRAKNGVFPDDKVGAALAALAVKALTPK